MTAFAKIILQLDSVEDSFIDTLERTVGTLFIIFPRLQKPQRESYMSAFSMLLGALHAKGSLRSLLGRTGLSYSS